MLLDDEDWLLADDDPDDSEWLLISDDLLLGDELLPLDCEDSLLLLAELGDDEDEDDRLEGLLLDGDELLLLLGLLALDSEWLLSIEDSELDDLLDVLLLEWLLDVLLLE